MMRSLSILALAFVLAACQSVTPPPTPTPEPTPDPTPAPAPLVLHLEGYSTPQFVNYPTMTLHNVTNQTTSPFVNRRIRVACLELGVYTYFQTGIFTVMPGQTTNVAAPYSGGYRMMVDANAFCTASVPSVPGQPEWIVRNLP